MRIRNSLIVLLLASCSPIYKTGQPVNYLRTGDTKQVVQRIYGQPDQETTQLVKSDRIDVWVYDHAYINNGIDTTKSITVTFINNKVK